jgi:hypothetical protein
MPESSPTHLSKAAIASEAKRLGAALVGFTPVSRWAEHGDLSWEFDPSLPEDPTSIR